jgi:hypothetical protein
MIRWVSQLLGGQKRVATQAAHGVPDWAHGLEMARAGAKRATGAGIACWTGQGAGCCMNWRGAWRGIDERWEMKQ